MTASVASMNRSGDQGHHQAFKSLFGGTSDSITSSATSSATFLKKFLAIAISNVAYLRALMPVESFRDRFMGDLHLKVLSSGKGCHPLAKTLIHLTKSSFDAIEKKYLKTLTLWFHEDRDKPEDVSEAYIFRFDYAEDESSVTLSRNQTIFSKMRTGRDVKKSIVAFLKTLLCTVESIDPLPARIFLKMQLSYYESRTPVDYHPRGFHHGPTKLSFARALTQTLDIGDVVSNHHSIGLRIKSTANGCGRDEDPGPTTVVEGEATFGLDYDAMEVENDAAQPEQGREKGRPASPSAVTTAPPPSAAAAVSAAPDPIETQLDVRCICGGAQDGQMIACGTCNKWQHAICYGVFPGVVEGLEHHACYSCSDDDGSRCLDPSLRGLTPAALKQKALFRRALLATAAPEVERLTNSLLCYRLTTDEECAQSLLDKMLGLNLIRRREAGEAEDEADGTVYVVKRSGLEKFMQEVKKKMQMRRITAAASPEAKKSRGTKRKARGESEA